MHDICLYYLFDIYSFIGVSLFLCIWFVIFNIFSMITYYCITYLNIYILFTIVFMYYMVYLFAFCLILNTILYSALLVGDTHMDVFFLSTMLCILESFSVLCSCVSTFLSMFCNLLSAHILILMFCEFIYFIIIFILFFSLFNLIYIISAVFVIVLTVVFYIFLYCLDIFCAMLQIYIFCNMIMQLITDFLLVLVFN